MAVIEPLSLRGLTAELENFQEIARLLIPQPGDRPRLEGFDIAGRTMPLLGDVGGDHIIYVDFKQRFDLNVRIDAAVQAGRPDVAAELTRCQRAAGIAMIDVSGHRITDALLAAMLHQAFLLGVTYELDSFGHVTGHLFENLNTRFYESSGTHKYVSFLYGEILEDATFRFLAAGQPFPAVYSSRFDRFVEIPPAQRLSFPPVGMMPSFNVTDRHRTDPVLGFKDRYEMNEWVLMGAGDVMLLMTDGVTEHHRAGEGYYPGRLEHIVRATRMRSASAILDAIADDIAAFGPRADDISLVVIKRLP